MRQYSYDVPAYKFGISLEPIREDDANGQNCLFDFDNFNGIDMRTLMLSDVMRNIQENGIILYCVYMTSNMLGYDKTLRFVSQMNFKPEDFYLEDKIEEVLEREMLKIYSTVDDFKKNIIKCFLERYRYYNKFMVEEVVGERGGLEVLHSDPMILDKRINFKLY